MLRRLLVGLFALSLFVFVAPFAQAAETAESAPTNPFAGSLYLTATYSIAAINGPGGFITMQPLGGEIGFRPDKPVEVGFSFDYGKSERWGSCQDCDGARRWQGVVRARVHLMKAARIVDPWLGGGVGVESLSAPKLNATGIDPILALDGVLETGVDFHLFGGLKVGPRFAIEYSLRGPEAPVWAYGGDLGPYTFEAGLRLAYAF